MKFKGMTLNPPAPIPVIVPHGDEMYTFKVRMMTDEEDKKFDELVPRPKPKEETLKGGVTRLAVDDPEFIEAAKLHGEAYTDYMILVSLSATEELEFETVKMDDPKTWKNIETELKAAGFTRSVIQMLFGKCISVNTLDSYAIEKARQDFLLQKSQG